MRYYLGDRLNTPLAALLYI